MIAGQPRAARVPLSLMARRMAPPVACGLITHSEALDALMLAAIDRATWSAGRLLDVEAWLSRRLANETEAWLARRALARAPPPRKAA